MRKTWYTFLVLLVTGLLGFSGEASAQKGYTFSPSAPIIMKSSTYTTLDQSISITNTSADTLQLRLIYFGDTAIKFSYNSQYITIDEDSTAVVTLRYRPNIGDTSRSWLLIHQDGQLTDTLPIIAMDTGFLDKRWQVNKSPLVAGSGYRFATDTLSVGVYNPYHESVEVTATLLSNSIGFSAIAPTTQTVPPEEWINYRFLFHSDQFDTAIAYVQFTGGGKVDTAIGYGRDLVHSSDSLIIYYSPMDTMNVGDTICSHVVIINPTDSAAVLRSLSTAPGWFFKGYSHPSIARMIDAGDTVSFDICVVAGDSAPAVLNAEFELEYDFPFTYAKTKTFSYSIVVNDPSLIPLMSDETELSFVTDSATATHTFRFVNNTGDTLRIISASLLQGTNLTITGITPTATMPFDLLPNATLEVTLGFTGTPGAYDDTLIIVTETGIVALRFPIEIIAQGQRNDLTVIMPSALLISPNPSSGPVNIRLDGYISAEIMILDIMGKVIARHNGGELRLDRAELSAGTYFVRAAGIGEDRKPFVITQRIVIE